MANKLYLLFCLIALSATLKAQTYADQQRQYRSYQAQHLATVRAYSVPSSSYTSTPYKSSTSSGSGYSSSNSTTTRNSGGTVASRPGSSNWSAYIRSDIKPWTNDDYDDYKSTNASYTAPRPLIEVKEAAYYRGSKTNSCQGDCSETLTTGGSFVYTGNTLNGVPNGKGVIKWKTAIYTGDVKNGMPDGEGSIVYENGISHKGSYTEGQFNGRGTMDYGSGSVFTGMFVKGMPTKGLQKFPNGMVYDGHFLNGEFHGLGELKWDKYLYNGDFKNGDFEGEGVLEVGNITFTGDFRKNKAYYGTIRWPSGDMFTGYVQTGIVNIVPKVGEQQDTNYTYAGWFDVNGKRSGYGFYTEKSTGLKMEGDWVAGDFANVGQITYANNQVIKGKINYKGVKVLGVANYQENWYQAHMTQDGTIAFLKDDAVKECLAALKEAEDFIIAGRKKYNDTMSATQ